MTDHQSTEITRDYQYPIELDFGDDKIKTINSAEEHKEVIDWCNSDKSEKTACFELVYPITMTMPDGSEITSEDAESFKTATGDWKKANPDKLEGEYSFNYPLDIVMGDELITIESDEDFEEAKLKCASEK